MTYYSWNMNIDSCQTQFRRDNFVPTWHVSTRRFTFPIDFNLNFTFPPLTYYRNNVKQEPLNPVVKIGSTLPKQENKTILGSQNTSKFDKMLAFIFKAEGGYTSNDCGQAGNKGIRQSTYDGYRQRKGLATQPVKDITDEEVREIYYKDYYVASGADKISDPRLAIYTFDTAVNMGVGASKEVLKQSGNNLDKFEDIRIARYESIAENKPEKAKYLNGWKNRVSNLEEYANKNLTA